MTPSQTEKHPNERSQRLLKVLVERYIRDGQPVGSKLLRQDAGLNVSSATVRNVMSDLEQMGFLHSPHTSAGRVPTVKGYRFFVDSLLTVEPVSGISARRIQDSLIARVDLDSVDLVDAASALLSDVTRLAGVVTLPRQERLLLRHVEFLPLGERRVLVILVVNDHDVQNRVINTDRDYSPAELQQAGNYLNGMCGGKDLMHLRAELVTDLSETRQHMDRMMQAAVEMAEKALWPTGSDEDYVLAGETNLMGAGQLSDMDKLRQLFESFHQKRELLSLLDSSIKAEGIQVFIGDESGYEALNECSVVAAPYEVDGELLGVLGVIGPTRMAYDRVIPVVDLTAKLLGMALNHR